MSEGDDGGVAVAQRLEPFRPWEERLPWEAEIVDDPSAYREAAERIFGGQDPLSEDRRAALAMSVMSGWAALSRHDLELADVRYLEDCVSEWPPELVKLGLPARSESRADFNRAFEEFRQVWTSWLPRPELIVDLGPRFVALGSVEVADVGSEVSLTLDLSQVGSISNGLIAHQAFFTDRAEALVTAGADLALLAEIEKLEPREAIEIPAEMISG